METTGKIRKINILYPILHVVVPIAVMVAAVALGVVLPEQFGLILSILGFGLAMLWWCFLSRKVYDGKKAKQVEALKAQGFTPNHTFNAQGCTVIVDLEQGQVALLFRWNPGKIYLRPASAVTDLRVDDGRGGAGFLEGSSRVSFLFRVEGVKFRVNTFTSNKRWRMDSDYILTGISKADVMVEALVAAGAQRAQ